MKKVLVGEKMVDVMGKVNSYSVLPEVLLNAKGCVKDIHGLLFLICVHCGKHTSETQAKYSAKEKGRVECIDCQRLKKKENKVYTCPEHVLKESDAGRIKMVKDCECCGTAITWGMIVSSLQVTSDYQMKKGKRMCKKCLITKYSNVKQEVVVEEVMVNA